MQHVDRLLLSLSGSTLPSLSSTKQLHCVVVTAALSHELQLLINSYSAHGDLLSARSLFFQIETQRPPVILYNSLIRYHARARQFSHAFALFNHLLRSTARPDSFTFATILRACSDNSDPHGLRAVHGLILSSGFGSDSISGTTLIRSYSRHGFSEDAVRAFDEMPQRDLVVYNTMLLGFGYGGFWREGLELFHRMRHCRESPDGYSLVGMISCFWDPDGILFAMGVHGLVVKGGFESNAHVRSVLVRMYFRLHSLESGVRLFREMSNPDLVMWSVVITGFSQAGEHKSALQLFREMAENSLQRTDSVLLSSVLSACGSMSAVGTGKEMHCHAYRVGLYSHIVVSCALIDFYFKCGYVQLGLQVFETSHNKNHIAYNTVISGFGSNGLGCEAVEFFDRMLEDGFKPDKATFSGVLYACAHSGLLEEGSGLFGRMRDEFGIEPQVEHYVYMVRLMGLAGKLDDAYQLIRDIPAIQGSSSGVWGALLWGCGLHGRSDLAEIAGQRLSEINPEKGAYKVMLSNVYASEGKWGKVQNLRKEMSGEKVVGRSWI